MSNEREFLSCAETAKLVRKALKAEFPGQKFSVRSSVYSGGASIDVEWFDGPTTKQVDKILGRFEGKGFDGMIDMAYYVQHWMLPDGSIQLAKSPGTEDSRGVYPKIENAKPHPDAKLVHFGADYVTPNRRYTRETLTKVAAEAIKELERWGDARIPEFEITDDSYGAYITSRDWNPVILGGQENIRDWIMIRAEKTSFYNADEGGNGGSKKETKTGESAKAPSSDKAIDEAAKVGRAGTTFLEPELPKTLSPEPVETPMDKMVKYLMSNKSPGDVLNILLNSGAVNVQEGMALIAKYV